MRRSLLLTLLALAVAGSQLPSCSSNPNPELDGGQPGGGEGGSDGGSDGGGTGGGAGGGGPPDAGVFVTADTYCAVSARVYCQNSLRCGALAVADFNACLVSQLEGCARIQRQLSAGRVTVDTAAVKRCLDAQLDSPCGTFFRLLADNPCSQPALKPAVPLTGQCSGDDECAAGFCPSAESCAGCTPFRSASESCSDGRCNPATLHCPVPPPASPQTCQPLLSAGARCIFGDSCQSKLCARLGDGGSECGPLAIGRDCQAFDLFERGPCEQNAFCKGTRAPITGGGSQTPGTCVARVGNGQPCTNEQFDDGCGDPKATCLNGTCTVVPFASLAEGAECDSFNQCAEGLFCRGFFFSSQRVGFCAPPVALGAQCAAGDRCVLGSSCRGGQCRPNASEGTACPGQFAPDCYTSALPLTCVPTALDRHDAGYTCQTQAALGAPCGWGKGCSGGYCELRDGGAGSCVAKRDAGTPCSLFSFTSGSECGSDRCVVFADGGARCSADCLP